MQLVIIFIISFISQLSLFVWAIEYHFSQGTYLKVVPSQSSFDISFGYSVVEMFEKYGLSENIIEKFIVLLKTGAFWWLTLLTTIILSALWFMSSFIYKRVKRSNAL